MGIAHEPVDGFAASLYHHGPRARAPSRRTGRRSTPVPSRLDHGVRACRPITLADELLPGVLGLTGDEQGCVAARDRLGPPVRLSVLRRNLAEVRQLRHIHRGIGGEAGVPE